MALDWITLGSIVGTVASIAGLIYAWVVARRSDRKKILTYQVSPFISLARVIPDRIEHRLSIIYERKGEEPINIKGAYLWFVTLGNLGREPIRREDIAPSDHLRIAVRDAKVLDIEEAGISRAVTNFNVERYEEKSDGLTVSNISFDFLDYRDAARVRILTDNASARINVEGTIIGMPSGIKTQEELGTLTRFPFIRRNIANLFFVFWMIIALAIILPTQLWIIPRLVKYNELFAFLSLAVSIILALTLPLLLFWLYYNLLKKRARLPDNLSAEKG